MNNKDKFLLELSTSPHWKAIVEEIKQHRPVVPGWNYEKDNTDEWKAKCHQQKGFDLVCSLLKINQ